MGQPAKPDPLLPRPRIRASPWTALAPFSHFHPRACRQSVATGPRGVAPGHLTSGIEGVRAEPRPICQILTPQQQAAHVGSS